MEHNIHVHIKQFGIFGFKLDHNHIDLQPYQNNDKLQ